VSVKMNYRQALFVESVDDLNQHSRVCSGTCHHPESLHDSAVQAGLGVQCPAVVYIPDLVLGTSLTTASLSTSSCSTSSCYLYLLMLPRHHERNVIQVDSSTRIPAGTMSLIACDSVGLLLCG
jgi:hypothetical protein